ncbi:NAD+ synthase [Pelagicoccus sp. SDUM812003]|uniref:NAD+ synthase n=1 Tax=Pelagicoccus sp. SDUM812003 TaxID=3041267 RepID=UPI0028103B9E|nr:NAD+ synthase [Pelagicoccus sp. SDUM812003]MDQ8203162.1 NAD+ synthase [Pelagicoccus sp. SDUM812003]
MKIGLAQINTTVGDLPGNRKLILDAYQSLVAEGADLVVFPELAVCGYPPRDLLFKRRFVPDQLESLQDIAAQTASVPAVLGFVQPNPSSKGRDFYNAAAFCFDGEVRQIARKSLLPTYDVFDEDRYFEPADLPLVFEWNGKRVGITICEDIWGNVDVSRERYPHAPVEYLKEQRLDLHLNLSASPWHCGGKGEQREGLVSNASLACVCPTVYVNAVGGNDELIFDGRSMVANAHGEIIAGLASFAADQAIVDLENEAAPRLHATFRQDLMRNIESALVLGLRDYVHKSGFRKALVGLSGGIDSAVTAAIAVEALGKENVIGISLPSAISSEHSKDDARDLAAFLGIEFHTVPIADIVSASEATLQPLTAGYGRDVTEENIQARARGLLLMALSNKLGALLLTTGNKSELAVGYCTLYGDMCGGLAVISDLPKTRVFDLARHMNRERLTIPVNTIEKPPSAELRPDQKDEDSLPPYDILDGILEGYVEQGLSSQDLIEKGYDPIVVKEMIRKVDLNEYKRKQAAPGLKLTPLAFGVGRRIPIVQRYVS